MYLKTDLDYTLFSVLSSVNLEGSILYAIVTFNKLRAQKITTLVTRLRLGTLALVAQESVTKLKLGG